MTTEDDFQAMLDANPDDHATRLIFADWLQERDDPRAEGYRALARQRVQAEFCEMRASTQEFKGMSYFVIGSTQANYSGFHLCRLPHDWFDNIIRKGGRRPRYQHWKHFDTRTEAEDATALAFATLSESRRAALLEPKAVPT